MNPEKFYDTYIHILEVDWILPFTPKEKQIIKEFMGWSNTSYYIDNKVVSDLLFKLILIRIGFKVKYRKKFTLK